MMKAFSERRMPQRAIIHGATLKQELIGARRSRCGNAIPSRGAESQGTLSSSRGSQSLTRIFHTLVAQSCTLLYRRIAFCGSPTVRARWSFSTLCRLQIGDTAECNSALRDADAAFRRNRYEILGLKAALQIFVGILGLGWLSASCPAAEASAGDKEPPDFGGLEIEELTLIKVTSVSKKEELLSTAPAAIHVITQDDIRRSGVTTIPEALRMAPGLQIARIDGHTWGVSSRGFNDVFANKLLVMIDGRSIYTPLFSGVHWDHQHVFLEDVDRIEVVRGPGASLWGANAVNGVINVISKSSKETQGGIVTGGGGTEERGFGGVRYGGKISEHAFYRIYGDYFDRDATTLPDGSGAQDSWRSGQGGFRTDWDVSPRDLLTFQGDVYGGSFNRVLREAVPVPPSFIRAYQDRIGAGGANFLSRWTHTFSEESELSLQAYYDGMERRSQILHERRHTFDLDGQYRFAWGDRQDVIWGLGYRVSHNDLHSSPSLKFDRPSQTTELFSAFVQDEISLVKDRLDLTLGTKLEHNDYTGFELQPSGRLNFKINERQSVWGAVSRAVRTPSQAEDDITILQQEFLAPNPLAPATLVRGFVTVSGNRDFLSEELLAYEIGYRVRPHDRLAFDVAGFYNTYDHLRTIEVGPVPLSPPLHIASQGDNLMSGETYGVELGAHWQAASWWRWSGTYSYLQMQLHLDPGSRDRTSEGAEGDSPHHQFALRSSMDLPRRIEFDVALRYVDSLPNQRIPSYLAMDVRLGWRPTKNLELAVVGQNLLDDRHPEFASSIIQTRPTEIQHSVYGKLTWRF
jgi:iron complex outermembrane receptor protein